MKRWIAELKGEARLQSRVIGTFWVTKICCIVSVLALMGVPAECDAMSITPSRIILNAECVEGNSQDIQAIFFGVGLNSFRIDGDSFAGEFYFAGEAGPVCITNSFHYCFVDDNLLVSFNRGVIQDYAEEKGLVDDVYEVEVFCSFYVTDSENNRTLKEFEGSDFVEILAPGNKKK